MEYITVKQAAEKWGLSERRIRSLCSEGRIEGIIRSGRAYLIPEDALKPIDKRSYKGIQIPQEYKLLFSSIDNIKNEIDASKPLTRGELIHLLEDFMVEFTYNAIAMEGNSLTLEETAQVLQGMTIKDKPLSDQIEAICYGDAGRYVISLLSDNVTVSEWVIHEIHSLVMIDKYKGKRVYRSVPVKFMGYDSPQPHIVSEMMSKLVGRLQKDNRHPIEKASLFLLEFERMQPFADGNNKTAHLILDMLLMQAGYPPVIIKCEDLDKYNYCLEKYLKDNDASYMVFLIGEYVKDMLVQYLDILKR